MAVVAVWNHKLDHKIGNQGLYGVPGQLSRQTEILLGFMRPSIPGPFNVIPLWVLYLKHKQETNPTRSSPTIWGLYLRAPDFRKLLDWEVQLRFWAPSGTP